MKDFADGLGRAPDMAVAVAAIRALTGLIAASGAQTMMGLEKELKDAAAALQRCAGADAGAGGGWAPRGGGGARRRPPARAARRRCSADPPP